MIDLESRQTVFSKGGDSALIPASAMKVFVMAAALVELGPAFSFETTLATDGTDLIVVGGGDPAMGDPRLCEQRGETITSEFNRWAQRLIESGWTALPGDLVIDESIFDDQWIHPSWEEDDLDNWYAAPVGALNFFDNCVEITVQPGAAPGSPVRTSIEPANRYTKIVSECLSGPGEPVLRHHHDSFEYLLSGGCDKRWPFGPVSFPDPGLLLADSLRTVLESKGVTVGGAFVRRRVRELDGTLPTTLTVVALHRTSLVDVLRRIGKNSQNLFAECLLKRIGYEWAKQRGSTDPQGSWLLGSAAVTDIFPSSALDLTDFNLADGSGLSRDNRCTARQLATILAWMARHPAGRVLHDHLSVAGVDGSLDDHLKDMPGRVYAKTGTMRGVRTLAGYVDGTRGPRFAFAVMFNGYRGPSTPYKAIQDRICRVLANRAG